MGLQSRYHFVEPVGFGNRLDVITVKIVTTAYKNLITIVPGLEIVLVKEITGGSIGSYGG